MSPDDARADQDQGALSPAEGEGTPAAVDVSQDRRRRWIWAMFLAGPIIWFGHFMLVYLVAEAGCTGDGPGLNVFDPPVPVTLTLVSSVLALAACAAATLWAFRHWQSASNEVERSPDDAEDLAGEYDDDRRRGALAFAGLLLSAFSAIAILFTAAPALVLGPC